MVEYLRTILTAQFEAALCMADDCLRKCPAEHWDSPVAKYPFWQVAYHALCFVDFYLSPGEQAFAPRPDLHPRGLAEMDDEYPSRRFEREELLAYVTLCRQKVATALAAETEESLQAGCGFSGRPLSRGELHVYNLRHLQHHVGQLGAFLRRVDPAIDPRWVGTGWR
jgi:DinB superfamily